MHAKNAHWGVFCRIPFVEKENRGRRCLEDDCSQFMAEDCRKGRCIHLHGLGGCEKQGSSVTALRADLC